MASFQTTLGSTSQGLIYCKSLVSLVVASVAIHIVYAIDQQLNWASKQRKSFRWFIERL